MNQTKSTSKKLLALLLALIMTVSLLPMSVFAAELATDEPAQEAEEAIDVPADGENAEDVESADGEEDGVAVYADTATPFTVDETTAVARALDTNSGYRIVHLDCGRKYFSVANIKKLIDTMAQYGYNQLQLAFGNGGCRFLLDDMSLSFKNVTMSSDDVKNNITNGNNAFNGDTRYLTEAEMTTIISYARSKNIEIVPMLNMPGHATAIVSGTDYSSSDNLNVNNETARYYGYALLNKYVQYFKEAGCKYFSFGADESGYTGENMMKFLTGCANVIVKGGMIPRAFNDATNVATMPQSVQITYWHQENHSQTASALANAGYEMINTHGRWYYVIKEAQNSEIGEKYWQGTVNSAAVSVELPVMKAEKMDKRWVGINEYFTADPGSGNIITNSKGTMFCIWCDASQDKYLTDSDVISVNENYGALYQLQKLAEHYWPNDIPAKKAPVVTKADGTEVPATMTTGGSVTLKADKSVDWTTSDSSVIRLRSAARANSETITGTTVTAVAVGAGTATITATDSDNTNNVTSFDITVQAATEPTEVSLTVGESKTFDVADSVDDGEKSANAYIATAKVEKVDAVETTTVSTSNATALEDGASYILCTYNNGLPYALTSNKGGTTWNGAPNGTRKLEEYTGAEDDNIWTLEEVSGGHKVKCTAGYLTIGKNTAYLNATGDVFTIEKTDTGWTFKNSEYYIHPLGGFDYHCAGGWAQNPIVFNLYKVTKETPASTTLTITGTGEGETTVTVGGTTYNIEVTAPAKEETVTVQPNGQTTLSPTVPTAGSVVYTLDANANTAGVELNGAVVKADADTGTARVTAEVKNVGGKVTARYTYTITVSDINWGDVESLPVELWITNWTVGVSSEDRAGFTITEENRYNGSNVAQVLTVSVPARQAYKEEGVLLSSLIPTKGYKSDETSVETVYWKGTVQTTSPLPKGDDLSASGVDFSRVRYWNNSWQYQAADGNWQDIPTPNTVAAFYLQTNDVSPEITTGTQHYGNPPTSDPGTNSTCWNLTAFAVVYPDGSLSRTEQEMFETGMVRGFWGGTSCNIGAVYAENNSTYRVSKMTVTWGANINGSGRDAWYTKEQTGTYGEGWGVKWDKVTNSAGAEWYDETTYWKAGDSEIPMIDGNKENLNLTTDYANSATNTNGKNAVLILIYLEAIEKETNLNVEYIDLNANNAVFHKYQIAMKYKEGDNEPTFTERLMASDGTLIGDKRKWDSNEEGNSDYLPDDAYVANDVEKHQTFNKEITTIPDINGIYASGLYEYIRADISEDGKTLRLYYNLKAEANTTYVVDFGLPVVIPFTAFGINNAAGVTVSFSDKVTELKRTGNYGNGEIDMAAKTVTYTLFKPLDAKTPIPVYVTDTSGETAVRTVRTVYIIPASNVYYEDSFVTFSKEGEAENIVGWTRVNDRGEALDDVTVTEKNATQALEELGGDATGKNVYGYDPAYDSCTTFSMGSAMMTTVSGEDYATATFTFKGTGFDIISLTDNTSGAIVVDVYSGSTATGTKVKSHIVDNYYGYKQETTADNKVTWVVDKENKNCLYQIPVMKIDGLPHGEYTAVITVFYDGAFDHTAAGTEYSFWLDAIRVYNPMGEDYTDYTRDGEGYPQYIKLRDELASSEAAIAESGVVFIDGGNVAEVDTYANYGPNNEVYLASGQAITFKLTGDLTNVDKIQIGAKSPDGTEGKAKLSVNSKEIASATEMYYDITDYANGDKLVTIANDGAEGTILSLTNLKVTFNKAGKSVSFASLSTENQDEAVATVRALFAAPVEPDPEPVIFTPERFEVSWNRSTVKVGQKATLTVKTSEDVEAITVDGVTIDTYRTRTQRTGWGWNAKKVTYREFTYTITANEAGTLNCSVAAVNAEGVTSEAITAALTVQAAAQRPSWGSWLDKIFSRWF